ncbi:hypothetical protein [Frigidibacter sp. MR17.24]|uniref:hypothetical protein n=1 Tax=Frigidibacter sp. MR17.24 TaxID=3127345 RepID=UPI003012AECF
MRFLMPPDPMARLSELPMASLAQWLGLALAMILLLWLGARRQRAAATLRCRWRRAATADMAPGRLQPWQCRRCGATAYSATHAMPQGCRRGAGPPPG